MISIYIQGLRDGEYEIDLNFPVDEAEDIYSEFFGEIKLSGLLRKFSNRYTFVGEASCRAKMICDITLNEFEELIVANISAAFLANTELYKSQNKNIENEGEEQVIHGEEKYLDLTKIVKDQLAVKLPMKRLSPEFRDKSFEEIYPEYTNNSQNDFYDTRWDELKKVKFN